MKFNYYLLSMLYALCSVPADAGVRVGNASRSYASDYQQVNAQREQMAMASQTPIATTGSADAETNLPVRVANADLAQKLSRGESVGDTNVARLESCAMIYPNGEFAWDTPTAGMGAGGAQTCVAVVELRGFQMGADGQDVVLARANLAAGDSFKCNISEFPEYSYTVDAGNIVFPADAEPTKDDVVHVMNQEQKQNAGLKIAAGTIVMAVAGNMAGKNEVGQDGMFGTGKHKTQSTLVGGLTGAAIMTANAYGGKVGGDVALSAGVNAAAGGMVGNIMASGDSVLRIEDCKINGVSNSCLWGMIVSSQPITGNAYLNIDDGKTTILCDSEDKNCTPQELVSIRLEAYPDNDLEEVTEKQFQTIKADATKQFFYDSKKKEVSKTAISDVGVYAKIKTAGVPGTRIAAMIPGVRDKTFGMKKSDWREWKRTHKNVKIYGRTAQGEAYDLPTQTDSGAATAYSVDDFYPVMVDATDGGIIDLGNKARLKSTLVGAGAGGALGAFSGYQGAQDDIEKRWVAAVREYKDSLQNVYCVTGSRFLGYYNDQVVIPVMSEQ